MADARAIASAVSEAIGVAATSLRPDVLASMRAAAEVEPSARGRSVLAQLIKNAEIAETDHVPLCQDTGTVWVRVEIGVEEHLGELLQPVIDAAVREAYRAHALRMSVVRDGLFDRTNTGDNTPAFIELVTRPGIGATVHVMLKGGGSDNSSALTMLDPSAGIEGVKEFVLRTVVEKATGACPPLVVGVGVGSTFDKVAGLAKRALLVPLGSDSPGETGVLERELLDLVNGTGIGPAGLGGRTTALGVKVLTAPCHIAALPVAVNMGCSAVRTATVEVV
ncbi:MAG: fumarate hydratase [Coriobacteriia bacterium]|nr:fumarate hydratase [Coriobacteriia bacterium]